LEQLSEIVSIAIVDKHLRRLVGHSICDSSNKLKVLIAEDDADDQGCLGM